MLRLFDLRAIEEVLAHAPRHPGAGRLRAAISVADPMQTLTRAELEERFLSLCRSARLPQPGVNAYVATSEETLEVDFLWRRERLIVETDGRASHSTRAAFERDRRRDQLLMLAGWRVVRFTSRQVTGEPKRIARTIATLLAPAES